MRLPPALKTLDGQLMRPLRIAAERVAAFPKHAQPLGGPPSWSLRLDLEGGMLSSGSDGMGLFSGSEELVGYLRQILTEAATQ